MRHPILRATANTAKREARLRARPTIKVSSRSYQAQWSMAKLLYDHEDDSVASCFCERRYIGEILKL
jgi:hypothetical protein